MSRKSYRPLFMFPYIGKALGLVLAPFLPIVVIGLNLLEEKFFWDDIVSNYKDLASFLKKKK